MEREDNLTRQADEVEALAAIYADEWCVVDAVSRIYCIQVTDGQVKPKWKICLQVHMPEEYPTTAPPQYQLTCPWLRRDERSQLEAKLDEIYIENLGENIIYQWVEEIRNLLVQKTDEDNQDAAEVENRFKNVTMERMDDIDDSDYDDSDEDFLLPEIYSRHPDEILDPEAKKNEDYDSPPITHGEPFTERRSTFQAHLAPITHKCQVQMVLDKLFENRKIVNATHNIFAYRIIPNGCSVVIQGCEDDGETHAGSRLLHLLKIIDASNVMVVVSRWFGGILLGPDRFKHINNAARQLCDQCGYIKVKTDDKHGRKNKK